jgi:N-acetylmuramoyl-L-alanine amidase
MVVLPGTAFAQSARTRYESTLAREQQLRERLNTAASSLAPERSGLVQEARRIIASYQALVRRYPASAYSDNALWQAAGLHRTLMDRFERTESRESAVQAYQQLIREYPSSSLVTKATSAVRPLVDARTDVRSDVRRAEAPPLDSAHPSTSLGATRSLSKGRGALSDSGSVASAPSAPTVRREAETNPSRAQSREASALRTPEPGETGRAMLTNIERTVLPEAVRITLSVDREVAYREERIAGPSRVFLDLEGVGVPPALRDASLAYGDDVVRHIRVGRHPNSTIRVVLDAEGVSHYSVFTLYNPFRLVIDCERTNARRAEAPALRTTISQPDAVPAARWDPTPIPASPLESPASAKPPNPVVGTRPSTGAHTEAPAPPLAATRVPSRDTAPTAVPPAPPVANSVGGFSIARQLGLNASRIVIDPGHGGRDPGASVRGLTEAELTLDVALRLEKLLQQVAGIEVILTRRTDEYIPLEERTAIANRENADLFLSIHANASRNTSARGVETYFLSFASSPEAEAVAARENAGSDRAMHNLPDIIKAIALNNKLDESRDLAGMVQESLVSRLGRVNGGVRDLGVKKAPFVVLIGAAMPSVLAEISFLTHKQDAQLLKTSAYRQRIAEALNAAVLRYRRSLKGSGKVAEQ